MELVISSKLILEPFCFFHPIFGPSRTISAHLGPFESIPKSKFNYFFRPVDVNDEQGTITIREAKQKIGLPSYKKIFNSPKEQSEIEKEFFHDGKHAFLKPGCYVFVNDRRLVNSNRPQKETTIKRGTIFIIDKWNFEDFPGLASLKTLDGKHFQGGRFYLEELYPIQILNKYKSDHPEAIFPFNRIYGQRIVSNQSGSSLQVLIRNPTGYQKWIELETLLTQKPPK